MADITVVIPVYNRQDYVGAAIESVHAQDIPCAELLVVDDGSTDGSVRAVEGIEGRPLKLIQQTNRGVSAARNRGIREASCEYIAFLDADDTWKSEFLKVIARLIDRYPEAGAYATSYDVVEPDGRRHEAKLRAIPSSPWEGLLPNYFESVATGANPVWSSAVCVKRSTFDALGGFPIGVNLYEDLQMWTRIALSFPIAFSTVVGSTYYRNAENRACNVIVPSVGPPAFSSVITEAIKTNRVDGSTAVFARMFIARYSLLNAFKCVVAGQKQRAKIIARETKPVTLNQKMRKSFVLLLCRLPTTWVWYVWRFGVALKGI